MVSRERECKQTRQYLRVKADDGEDVTKDLTCYNSTDCLEETCSVVLKEQRKALRYILREFVLEEDFFTLA